MELNSMHIDTSPSKEERVKSFLKKVNTPYTFEIGGMKVKVTYPDTNRTLQEGITRLVRSELRSCID